ncbi:1-deoxy-D-xylulose 5-phosphate reductoisomerase [cyanobacterium endosymbiont of Braarudosphaera bigelowii]|uniref:1-deoxy-D-xylulose 5-phosphate reductoisomerase n=1 Tax=cyanobacterium endosymbiont of Braarudosphaera bigelowii TaxID=1285375 RepID=A0ABN6JYN0_9CHRO|nr:1-deoxy-D-xylulose 5-phosphate reductoisomerase [cyanobacterium endosymbiont of Braarudosphaera bigelowii]
MLLNLIIFITSIIIISIIFRWIFTVIKSTFLTLVSIIIVLTLLKLTFDVDDQELSIKIQSLLKILQDFYK